MLITNIRTIWGPNVFHHRPVLILELDLQDLAETSSADLPGFTDRLISILPGLHKHRCSRGYEGGFVERLGIGTYPAHIVEHVALELSTLAGIEVGYGKTVYGGAPGNYKVAVRFRSEPGMRYLLEQAVTLVQCVVDGECQFDLQPVIDEAERIVRRSQLGPSTKAIVDAAERRGIPWERLNDCNLVQLGYGAKRKFIQATTTSCTGDIAVDIAQDKDLTKKLLKQAALPVPAGEVAYSAEEALGAARRMGGPVALKPLNGNHGNGVCLNLTSDEEILAAFAHASRISDAVLVEEMFLGHDHRVLVVGGKMIAAARRVPASVVGDGSLTLRQLVDKENQHPLRGEGHEKAMTRIEIDDATISFLARKGISLGSVPEKGSEIFLREAANLSQGGRAIDVTDQVHPSTRLACERAAKIVGLDICGIDLVLQDVSRPIAEQPGGIIEVNAGPGIRMHHYPAEGKPRDAGGAIVDFMFPKGDRGRIPIVSITGTNGKTTVTRLTGHMLAQSGKCVGVTTSDGIFLNGECIAHGDTTGPVSAHTVLNDPSVEIAVLETARGGIVKRGLGYDWSDVGVLTNIQPDHIGQDGIETVEDILRIKSLVAERVRPGGALVLNADDPHLLALAEREGKDRQVILFSVSGNNPAVIKHCAAGGWAYQLKGGRITETKDGVEHPLVAAAEVPLTLGGTARFQIANAMAALAAARALGQGASLCLAGLKSFRPNENNSGRVNTHRVGKGYLVADYGHNPEAFTAIGEMLQQWNTPRVTGVIAVPGDRSDEILRMGAAAAARVFDRIIIREDLDLRGRRPGEAAGILCEAVKEESPGTECRQMLCEKAALALAIGEMMEGETIVFFYDDFDLMEQLMRQHQAVPLTDFSEIGIRQGSAELVRAS